MTKTAVVILNWNGRQFLEIFLKMIIDRSAGAQIWVADNGSDDSSVKFLENNFPEVHILQLGHNYGYTGGYNRAIEAIDAEYYILLNSDIEVTDGWLDPLISLMDDDNLVAAVQPKIRSFAEKDRFEYAGACGGFIDILGYPFCRGRFIGQKTEKDTGQYDDSREIFWATGAAFAVRGDYFKKLGGLDELFFAHMEEIDLCWRFKRAGYKILVVPQSTVFHVGGGTLPVWSPTKTYLNFRNNIAMLYKNLEIRKFIIIYFIRLFTDMLRVISYILPLKFKFAEAVIKGHIDFWKMRKKLDRKNDIGHKKVSCIYNGSIVIRKLLGKGTFGHMMSILFLFALLSCKGNETGKLAKVVLPEPSSTYTLGEMVKFNIDISKKTDSVTIQVCGKRLNGFEYKTTRVGHIDYIVTAYKGKEKEFSLGNFLVRTNKSAPTQKIKIISEYPHKTDAYTQGLIIRNGEMFESTGEYGKSSIRKVDMKTGDIKRIHHLSDKVFGEGLELVDGELFQITWREKTCYRYDSSDFTKLGSFGYTGEGWGLATDGKKLYMSDGSSRIRIISPDNFRTLGFIDVMDQRGEIKHLNEMEWIDGFIWANIYTTNLIAVINPLTGEVENYIDCSELESKITKNETTDVLNGIARDDKTGDIYITGKNWDKLFKVTIQEK